MYKKIKQKHLLTGSHRTLEFDGLLDVNGLNLTVPIKIL